MQNPHHSLAVLVFRTHVRYKKDQRRIAPVLDGDGRILQWSVDLADRDKVLRIVTDALLTGQVVDLLQGAGYACEELPD